jgi:hypothetical protein
LKFSARPIFCGREDEPGTKLVVEFKLVNQGSQEIQVMRWGIRTTHLQVVWQAAFNFPSTILTVGAAHEARGEIADDVAKALMTGAEAFCEDAIGNLLTVPVIVPVVQLGQRR